MFLQNKQQLNKLQNSSLQLYTKDSNFEIHMLIIKISDTMQFEFRISNFKNFKWKIQYMQILVKVCV